MKLVKTVSCKLNPTPEQAEALKATMQSFADACNYVLEVARKHKTTNKVKLQHLCYYDLKKKFGLTANLAIRAIARVAEASKRRLGRVKHFSPTSVSYDQRIFRYIAAEEMVSLSTLQGRIKVPLILGNYQRHLLKDQKPTSAVLVYQRGFYINIVLSKPVPRPSGTNPVGIDLGINNLATCSNGIRFPGGYAMHIRRRFRALRAALQSKGTRGAKKLLRRLSGRESRIIRNINHVISRRIVDSLREGDVIVMEKLTHIKDRTKVRKERRYIHHSWPFAQLAKFIEYKALEKGIPVVYVDPRNSSHTCPRCGELSIRNRHSFYCPFCGYRNHADFAASFELANRGRALLAGPSSAGPEAPAYPSGGEARGKLTASAVSC